MDFQGHILVGIPSVMMVMMEARYLREIEQVDDIRGEIR